MLNSGEKFENLVNCGFSDDQIISVANNILDCLVQTLDGYKEKSEKRIKPHTETGPGVQG